MSARRRKERAEVDGKVVYVPASEAEKAAMEQAIVWLALAHLRGREAALEAGKERRLDQGNSPRPPDDGGS